MVLFINSSVFKLLLRVSQMGVLSHFDGISPHIGELNVFILRVHIVEHGEFRTNEVSEMPDFNISEVVSEEEFMMPDHSS